MKPIVKFRLTKSVIISTLHAVVRYGPRLLGGIRLFGPFVIQGIGKIAILIKHYYMLTPSRPLLRDKQATLQLEVRRVGRTLEDSYMETQEWL